MVTSTVGSTPVTRDCHRLLFPQYLPKSTAPISTNLKKTFFQTG